MTPIQIVLKNNLTLRGIDEEVRNLLIEKLTIPNPKYLENARMGRWNRGTPRTLRYYRKLPKCGLRTPRGYLRQMILFFRKNDLPYALEDHRRTLPEMDFQFSGKLKPFQEIAVNKMLQKDFGTLNAPTGSGKTVMGLYMLAQRRQPALIVVHTKDLAYQWMSRIETFLGISEKEIGIIGGGRKRVGPAITVALVQSLYKIAADIALKTGFIIVDECHRCPSRTFTEAVTNFDSRYMLGLSATPFRRDKLSKLIFWHLGDVHHEIDNRQLVESGDVLAADVHFRKTTFTPYFDPVNDYSRMLSELTTDDERNRLIADDVAREALISPGTTLVLSDRKKHCEALCSLIRYRNDAACEFLTGDRSEQERKEIIQRLNHGHIKILVATGQLIGEGFDCPNLATLFFATPVRFSGRVLQYIGRVLRPAPGKKEAKIIDYIDINVDVLVSAARARERVYQKL
ncbi:MAG: DEAD/DEAH box helicase [Desulfobacterales bacterium]|nr:DEAD/DEAH box helicase [Desulfobacterales bacterium]